MQKISYVKRKKQNVEEQIQRIIDNQAEKRKLIIISGEYGIGKTSLLNEVMSMIQYKNYLNISLEKEYYNSPMFLKEITTNFINRLKIDDSFAQKGVNFFTTIIKLLPGISIGNTDSIEISFSDTKKAILDLIENRWHTYISQIDAIEYQGENYVFELVRIISSAVFTCQTGLYVVIDNFDCLDMQTFSFLSKISEEIPDLSIILTMESNLQCVTNSLSIQLVSNFLHTNKMKKEILLSPFDQYDTRIYLSQQDVFSQIQDINNISEQAYEFSGGLPLLLSIVCDENEFWITQNRESNKSITLDMYYQKLLKEANPQRKCILFYFVANEGKIEKDILNKLIKKEKNNDLQDAFVDLFSINIIIDFPKDCYRIKAPILCNYIKKHIKEYSIFEGEYKQKLLKAYHKSNKLKNISERYSRMVTLAIELGEWDKSYNYAIEGCKELYAQMKYDVASDILKFLLKEGKLSSEQKIYATIELIRHLYNDKRMSLLLEYYYSVYEQLDNVVDNNINISTIHLIAAKAHYYLNQVKEAIMLAQKELSYTHNSYIYFQAKLIIISAYDLQGDYDKCFLEYDNAIKEIEQEKDFILDDSLRIMFDTVCQMRLNDAFECIGKLENVIRQKQYISKRTYICCYNNLGIEYLMNGQFEKAKIYLEMAKTNFLTYYPAEAHFSLNNLGLYYLYSTSDKNEETALQLLEQAYKYSVSPLQHAYTLMNIANVYFIKGDYIMALEKIKLSENYVKECPDPIVHSYFHYNSACIAYYSGDNETAIQELKQSYSGLQKPQLALLYKKRNELAMKLECNEIVCTSSSETTRRSFWSTQIYEPCELMFYN